MMMQRWRKAAALLLVAMPVAAQHSHTHDARALAEDPRQADSPLAPILEGLGDVGFPISTSSKRAQRFFDQGLALTYAFNHQEALRSFKEAARLDPESAMAYWGWALVLGPNLNLPMQPEVEEQALTAIGEAMARRAGATPRERLYIEALAKRYAASEPEEGRGHLDRAYAEAMAGLHSAHPEDVDAATLYAAALMNLSPWSYWQEDGSPKEHTPKILELLEGVMEKAPNHTGALHYYIHAVEPVDAERGVAAADALTGLAPGAGHLVHMPSHIYMQVGRYADAYEANAKAVEADEGYITQCRAQGIYPLGYYPHNIHFLAWAAILQGRSQEALEASRKVAARVPEDYEGNTWALYQSFLSMPLYALVRFGRWQEILQEPEPPANAPYVRSIWHFARGMAHAHGGDPRQARRELAALRSIAGDRATAEVQIGFNRAPTLLSIASSVLRAEILASRGRHGRSIRQLRRALALEDSLPYNEPPDWFHPVRHVLGAVLLEAGRPQEAETVFRRDLERHRDNGYALTGLAQSLEAQGRSGEAAEARKRLEVAWSAADHQLSSSRF